MSYTLLTLFGLAGAVSVDLLLLKTRLMLGKAFWVAYAILFGFQLLVNGILTGIPIVSYRASAVVGIRIGYAPVEDLGFGFALILLTLSCWVQLGRRERRAAR